jgi:hypothetical protein
VGCQEGETSTGCQIFLVPLDRGVPVSPDLWIAIGHPSRWDDKPRWSPSGKLIYFISDRDGYLCLWAQSVNSPAGKLIGAPFPVYHFHHARLSMTNVGAPAVEIGVAKDKIVMGLGELTGNIWSLKRSRQR